jgi:outer membrane protein assembly factor BamB
MKTRIAFFGVAMVLLTMSATADDWPQWRGPNRDNKVTGFDAPATWPKALSKKWTVKVGEGLSSPALVGDKLFVFTREGDQEVARCLDLASGKEVWKEGYKAERVTPPGAGGGRFTGTRSSPAVGDGKVCTFGVAGVLTCRDAATGKQLWQKETKGRPSFFTSCSPVITEGLCIVHTGGGRGASGQLTAYELATGNEKWSWDRDPPSYGSPIIATLGGTKQVVELTDRNLVGVSLADGKDLWSIGFKQSGGGGRAYQTATPVIAEGHVILAGRAFAIDASGGKFTVKDLEWSAEVPHIYNTPVLKDGKLYGLTGSGSSSKLFCQDARSGAVLWIDSMSRGECGEIYDVGAVLIALSSDTNLLVFKPSDKGYEEVAKYKVADTPTWASPVLTGKMIVVKDRDSVIAWSLD